MNAQEQNQAKEQAAAQLSSIVDLVKALNVDYNRLEELRTADELTDDDREELAQLEADANGNNDQDEALERLEQDALSVTVRSPWYAPGDTDGGKPAEFRILLCTGGPAVQIIGELDDYGQPENPKLQYQDWFTPWTDYTETTEEEAEALQTYCEQFYFGE